MIKNKGNFSFLTVVILFVSLRSVFASPLPPFCDLPPGATFWFKEGVKELYLVPKIGGGMTVAEIDAAAALQSMAVTQEFPLLAPLGNAAPTAASVVCRAGLWGIIAAETAALFYLKYKLKQFEATNANALREGRVLDIRLCNIVRWNLWKSGSQCPLPNQAEIALAQSLSIATGTSVEPASACTLAIVSSYQDLFKAGHPCYVDP